MLPRQPELLTLLPCAHEWIKKERVKTPLHPRAQGIFDNNCTRGTA